MKKGVTISWSIFALMYAIKIKFSEKSLGWVTMSQVFLKCCSEQLYYLELFLNRSSWNQLYAKMSFQESRLEQISTLQ